MTTSRLLHTATRGRGTRYPRVEAWQQEQQAAGHQTLADVPAPVINGESVNLWLWRNAVYTATRALILERYRDADTNGQGRPPGGCTRYTDIGFVARCEAGPSLTFCAARESLRSCADESEGTGRRHRGFALFPVLRHDAGRHRKGAGCQPRTLSAGISPDAGQEVEMPEPEKKKREMIQLGE